MHTVLPMSITEHSSDSLYVRCVMLTSLYTAEVIR